MPYDYPYGIEGASTPKMHLGLQPERILRVTPNMGHVETATTGAWNLTIGGPNNFPQSVYRYGPDIPHQQFHYDWKERAQKMEKSVPSLVLDFGREVHGSLHIEATHLITRVKFGESLGEAEDGGLAQSAPMTVRKGYWDSGETAFRYAKLYFVIGDVRPRPVHIWLDFRAYPVAYRGAFACSDDLLTRIWYVGAYTAHLCMQEDVWDAAKRDRLRWMGDVNVEWPTIWAAFGDKALIEQTMHRLRVTGPPKGGHINGIAGYSLFWILSLRDLYTFTGDRAYLQANHDALLTLLDFFRDKVDKHGLFAEGSFVDWARLTPEEERATTHLLLCRALADATYLLTELGDKPNADRIAAWRDQAKQAARTLLHAATSPTPPSPSATQPSSRPTTATMCCALSPPLTMFRMVSTSCAPTGARWFGAARPRSGRHSIPPGLPEKRTIFIGTWMSSPMAATARVSATPGLLARPHGSLQPCWAFSRQNPARPKSRFAPISAIWPGPRAASPRRRATSPSVTRKSRTAASPASSRFPKA
jgi:hypothetical protein